MQNPFKKTELPPIADLLTTLLHAIQYLHPDWDDESTVFNSTQIVRGCKSHMELATVVNGVCKSALDKRQEIAILSEQFQLSTEINN
jgi:hypothetical protein